jgi:hypothetical protein
MMRVRQLMAAAVLGLLLVAAPVAAQQELYPPPEEVGGVIIDRAPRVTTPTQMVTPRVVPSTRLASTGGDLVLALSAAAALLLVGTATVRIGRRMRDASS